MLDTFLQQAGQQALAGMVSHLIFIIITWRVLQAIKLEGWVRKDHVFEVRVLMILVTITIGTSVSRFFLDFLQWSQQLVHLF
ncbi:hypothetical protein GCM10007216_15740 [Thalassobacillus devorans]|uniref:DUF1146 domain-containing protein n=2 Tax=Thalassobacillus devorans TaxID=279813 RepID=A0ABQ1P331_9BACI|nr:DUF1146 family protein [Thalassobacillus devorans]NIK28484.1 putative integral membrane protein (TIGR02327 family) [Thalassobacillus devorans]GGC85846.1 hypothetical protein GCM10007216_15740 [Thalassobacillus devorans]